MLTRNRLPEQDPEFQKKLKQKQKQSYCVTDYLKDNNVVEQDIDSKTKKLHLNQKLHKLLKTTRIVNC